MGMRYSNASRALEVCCTVSRQAKMKTSASFGLPTSKGIAAVILNLRNQNGEEKIESESQTVRFKGANNAHQTGIVVGQGATDTAGSACFCKIFFVFLLNRLLVIKDASTLPK